MKQFWPLFLEIAAQYPAAIAIRDNGKDISYAHLSGLAAAVGETLKRRGIGAETPVALEMEKSVAYIAGLLGCWYAGAAFVPLPPSLPQERRDYILRDADIKHTLTPYDLQKVSPHKGDLDPAPVTEDTLAYIIYTSGSTGAPKGVMVEHRGIVNFLEPQIEAFGLTAGNRYLFYLSILFDAALSDIGVCLLSGATLVIEPPSVLRDGKKLVRSLHDLRITHTDIPPSLLKVLVPEDVPQSLKTIVIGGEVCPPETVRQWAERFRVVNVYGPTEATVCTSFCLCDAKTWNKPLIGMPLPGITYHIYEDELYIGGVSLARGYLKQPELTAQKFIRHDNLRLYKTGDRVRRLDDGTIEFLGRRDRQFKLRGQLVEPDEIEAALAAHPAILRAAILKRDERLVAFAVIHGEQTSGALKKHLAKFLPSWMIPQQFVFLQNMPCTATGKPDYKALEKMPFQETPATASAPPENALEKQIWELWRDILRHEDFGVTDEFFQAGGDSLDVIRMTLEAERRGIIFSGGMFASGMTIREIAANKASANVLSADWLKRDVAFDDAWQAFFDQAKDLSPAAPAPQNIFFTGASGFLGSRLLHELLTRTTADIYCLVRAGNSTGALKKIEETLKKYEILPSVAALARIRPVCGDLEKPHFGMDENAWQALAQETDAVYHCAAKVNMVLPYSDLRPANVGATREILRFACTGRRKHIHYASTLSVFVGTDRNKGQLFETNRLENVKRIYGGYAQTKWAAEWMLLQVPQDVCRITHYRYGLITGDTKHGAGAENDSLAMFAKGVSSFNCAPQGFDDKLYVDITPVDYAATATAYLSLNGNEEIYHIAHGQGLSLGRLLSAIRRQGISLRALPAARWTEVVENKAVKPEEVASHLALCRCLPEEEFERHRTMDLFQATGVTFDTRNTDNALHGTNISHPAITDDLLDVYLNQILKDKKHLIKVCLFGPESTGKSTLAHKLAAHYQTACVEEYAKELIFAQDGNISLRDIPRIARGQIKAEKEGEGRVNEILFCDTDLLTTTIWSDRLFGTCPQWIRDASALQTYDLYLLMDTDTPWIADLHRFLPDDRPLFLQKCRQVLEENDIKYITLSGTWENKFDTACAEIDILLRKHIYTGKTKKAGND